MGLQIVLTKAAVLSSASAINVALLSLMSLLLAKLLTVEEFGITRSVTAYMIVLTMLGHLTFHDALASKLARQDDREEQTHYFSSAAFFVVINSTVLALLAVLFIHYSGLWGGAAKVAMTAVVLCLPLAVLSILFNSSLQAIGRIKTMAIVQIANGAVPFLTVLSGAFLYQMPGWIAGRVTGFVFLAVFSFYFIRRYIRLVAIRWSSVLELMTFARLQIWSGILSMVLMSADVILLERLTGDMTEVAQYGLAIFFVKATMFVPTSISRIYFREIAKDEHAWDRFLLLVLAVCGVMAVALFALGPMFIAYVFRGQYDQAAELLRHLCVAVVFMGLWQAISTVNVASGKPERSLVVSLSGTLVCMALLLYWVPAYASFGAAWAINIGYASGVLIGLFMLVRTKWQSCQGS